jgi:hypothetical protein
MLKDLTAFCPAGIQELRDTFEFDYQELIDADSLTNLGIHPRRIGMLKQFIPADLC